MRYSPDPTLTDAQHQVLTQIAEGASITAAAEFACVHRNTVANWRRTVPAFAAEFEFAARERALYWQDAASALAPKALEVLHSILHDESAPKSLRLRVALKILNMSAAPQPQPAERPATPPQAEAPGSEEGPAPQRETAAQIAQRVQAEYDAQCAQSGKIETIRRAPEPGRNTLCPCRSGLKFKRCCANKAA